MAKLYGFKFDREIADQQWRLLIAHSFSSPIEPVTEKPPTFFLYSEENISASLCELLPVMESDLACQIGAIICHNNEAFTQAALDLAFQYQRGQLLNLADVCLIASIKNEVAFLNQLKNYFNDTEEELLHTAIAFLQNSLSGLKTAEHLYIHRNTLSYRLNKLQQLKKLNIHDFDDAAFLRFWYFYARNN